MCPTSPPPKSARSTPGDGDAPCRCVVPSGLDHGLARTSERGLFRVELLVDSCDRPDAVVTRLGVRLAHGDGTPADGARLGLAGGMPQLGRRLSTPLVVTPREGGHYDIDGLVLDAPGWWLLQLAIETPTGADVVTFNLRLPRGTHDVRDA